MHLVLELWRLMNRRQRRGFVLLQAVALVMAVSTLIGIAAIVPFFAVLGDPQRIARSALLSWCYGSLGFASERAFLLALGVGSLAVILLANAINWLGTLAMNRFAYRIGDHFSVALFEDYLQRDYQFHLLCNSATLLNNVVWETGRGTTGILQFYFALSTNLVAAVLIIASLIAVDPLIAGCTLIGLTAGYSCIYLLVRQRLLRNGQLESRHTQERTRIAAESFGGIKEISLLNAQRYFRDAFRGSCEALSRAGLNTQSIAQSPRYIMECLVVGGLIVAALILVQQHGTRGPWLAQLTYLGLAAYRLLPALQQIFHAIVRIRADRVAFAGIAEDLRRACRREAAAPPPSNARCWIGRPQSDIRLTDVEFRYDADRPAAIGGISLRIAAGSTVGIVGPSGCGKTTLAELILGLLCPAAGSIAVDGVRLDAANRRDWQATIAYVPQRIFLFDATLAENIALAAATEQVDQERLRSAVRLAQLDSLVAMLPGGYAERLGEQGVRLSGGQRQRIGIARALYRQASVLVLDEATNALDRLTEDEIMSTLEALRGERTIILIAHRLSTALRCDLIFDLDGGRVVGSSSPQERLHPPCEAGAISP
jgi:ABC-type bacteriocin/lantibiotic exporter with double-glycine peptidase domain